MVKTKPRDDTGTAVVDRRGEVQVPALLRAILLGYNYGQRGNQVGSPVDPTSQRSKNWLVGQPQATGGSPEAMLRLLMKLRGHG